MLYPLLQVEDKDVVEVGGGTLRRKATGVRARMDIHLTYLLVRFRQKKIGIRLELG